LFINNLPLAVHQYQVAALEMQVNSKEK
jgi:hypothetical protein